MVGAKLLSALCECDDGFAGYSVTFKGEAYRSIKQGVRKFATMFLGSTKQMVTGCDRPI